MSSSQDSDSMGGQDRKSAGFVKSVIKALSGSRFMSPDGSTRASPTIEQLDTEKPDQNLSREQYSDEVDNHGSYVMESAVERGYESLPTDRVTLNFCFSRPK